MKSIFKSMSCLVLGAMIVTPMFAQQKKLYPELEGSGPVVIISKDKNGKEELINVFEETQRPHFHDPRAPRFLLTDQQGKFALGIGGYLKTTMEYDFNGIVDDVDFIPALIPHRHPLSNLSSHWLHNATGWRDRKSSRQVLENQ
jgi:hypothetical protein